MDYRIYSGTCNCLGASDIEAVHQNLLVIDSEKLPKNELFIIGIVFDNILIGINQKFNTLTSFISYLNTTFNPEIPLNGTFQLENHFITYSNVENFNYSEIMAIYGTRLLCYKFGLGGPVPIDGWTDEFPEGGDTIPGTELIGSKLLNIDWVDSTSNIPLTTNNLTQDPISKAITFTQPYDNGNMWILVADEIPTNIVEGFPYDLPITF